MQTVENQFKHCMCPGPTAILLETWCSCDRRSLVCRAPLGLQSAAGLAKSRWPAKRSLGFFFCFRDTAGRCAGRRGATQGGWWVVGARKKGRAGLGRACRVGSRWPCGCCLVAQEGLMGKQGDVGRSAARHHSSLISPLLLVEVMGARTTRATGRSRSRTRCTRR